MASTTCWIGVSAGNGGRVTYRCNIFTFTDPDSPYSRATIRWGITVTAECVFKFLNMHQQTCQCTDFDTLQYWGIIKLDNLSSTIKFQEYTVYGKANFQGHLFWKLWFPASFTEKLCILRRASTDCSQYSLDENVAETLWRNRHNTE